ncbi:hypothetical protein I4U23_014451 [Adineta vaga]|nr:hypothetical protein I4U23_014451 [Adineta vaga]
MHSSQYNRAKPSSVNSSNQNHYYDKPLINSAGILDTMSDEEIARQHQEDLFSVQSMENDEPFQHVATPIHSQPRVDINADEAYALRLQEEEYSRRSLNPSRSYRAAAAAANNKSPPIIIDADISPVLSDAELAAHLQAEEEQRGRRIQQRPGYSIRRPTFPSRPPLDPTIHSDEPEVIPMQRPTLRRPPRNTNNHNNNNNNNNNDNTTNITNIFQFMASNAILRPNGRRPRDVQNSTDDFGPNDYERLLELDNSVRSQSLTDEQINRLPTEPFQGARNKSDEENKCSVCWDDFEQNQILRRLRCFHLYHKDCIDKWLKDNNQCPICRVPPIV